MVSTIGVSAQEAAADLETGLATVTQVVENTADQPSSEDLAWEAARASGVSEDVFAFIEMYPDGVHTKEAKALMIDILWAELEEPEPVSEPEVATSGTVEETVATQQVADVVSDEVELRSMDNLISVVGTIVAFDDALITIDTSYGVVGIENDAITCIGAACPPELLAAP